ncbi:MAG: 23S rRNA (adenine(2503)-C(2))-methyltransferase RlmN [Anaerolineae bacterium]
MADHWNVYELSLSELEALFKRWGEPAYRARQLWTWLYQHLATDFNEMTSLPKALRRRLAEETTLYVPPVLAQQLSLSGETRKDLLEMRDGERVEVVLMRYIDRRTACISTQVGCALGCAFCATGQMGFVRDLTAGEIVAQVLHFQRELAAQGQQLSNVVFMGMGEPFLNYDATLEALHRLMHPGGLNFGQRRMTISSVGIVPGIYRFAEEELQVNLAISLHAATDALRSELMPINRRYPLDALFTAVGAYIARTNRQVTFEWALIEGINDTLEQAEALAARIEGMLAHVNLIPLNPTEGFEGQPAPPERVAAFTRVLDRHHISHTVRLRRGIDIRAGCGQLRKTAGA